MNDKIKILIIRLSALGDTIHTLPLVSAIKKAYPNSSIGWIVEDKAKQFVQNNPLVDKCFVIPKKKWKRRGLSMKNFYEFSIILKNIEKEKYDIVIDTQQLFKSASLMMFLNIKKKLTNTDGREFSWLFANEFLQNKRKQFDKNYHVVKRNMEFAKYFGIEDDEIRFFLPTPTHKTLRYIDELTKQLDSQKKTIVIAPATTWANKHWAIRNWIELINTIEEDTNIVITGSSKDRELVDEIKQGLKKEVFDFSGQTNLEELTELYRRVDLVISPDSGSAHIAWATQKPAVIAIFCATSPMRTGPFGDRYFSIGPDLKCAPCMKKKCKLKRKEILCTNAVSVEQVLTLVKNILQTQ